MNFVRQRGTPMLKHEECARDKSDNHLLASNFARYSQI